LVTASYPVHVDADLDPRLGRWLWLVKWLLAIPHYVVLFFLWIAFVVLSAVAFFAILFTGRYPRGIFDFNVGVLRWTWRVSYYAYGALATDRYPPFSLHEDPGYPAHLAVDYPANLSRGLVLVKWWLLAIPHYLVTGVFVSGGLYVGEAAEDYEAWGVGLISLLVFFAAVVLLFTGRYPATMFDLVMGLNRWVLRVAGYAALMTDEYPPFRLDQGGRETTVVAEQAAVAAPPGAAVGPGPGTVPATGPDAGPRPGPHPSGWTAGRVVTVVAGCVLTAMALGLGFPATAVLAADVAGRDEAGFLMSREQSLATPTYAIASRNVELHVDAPPAFTPRTLLGDAKLTATSRGDTPVFIGIARTSDVEDYLDGVQHVTLLDLEGGDRRPVYRQHSGTALPSPPDDEDFWVARSAGTGTQEITWELEDGDWTVVVMNADAEPRVVVDVAAGAEVPALGWLAGILFAIAAVMLLVGVGLVVLALRLVATSSRR
jgi:hypothetical protein